MTVLPPFLLVFDSSALLAGKTRDWERFSRIGECVVPAPVLDDLRSLSDRAIDATTQSTAREFLRFYPQSGWIPASAVTPHPLLQPNEGHALSSKARLSLAVAQVTYALAQRRSAALVVLITNDQGLVRTLRGLEVPNLCGIPLAALLQWSRIERTPPVVAHQRQVMFLATQSLAQSPNAQLRSPTAVTKASTTRASTTKTSTVNRATAATVPRAATPTAQTQRSSSRRSIDFVRLWSNLLSLLVLAVGASVAWRVVSPTSFAQFWDQLPLPQQERSH